MHSVPTSLYDYGFMTQFYQLLQISSSPTTSPMGKGDAQAPPACKTATALQCYQQVGSRVCSEEDNGPVWAGSGPSQGWFGGRRGWALASLIGLRSYLLPEQTCIYQLKSWCRPEVTHWRLLLTSPELRVSCLMCSTSSAACAACSGLVGNRNELCLTVCSHPSSLFRASWRQFQLEFLSVQEVFTLQL